MLNQFFIQLSMLIILLSSVPCWAGIVSIHDPQIAGVIGTSYYIFRNEQKIQLEKSELTKYIEKLTAEINETTLAEQDALTSSREAANGKMIPKDLKRVYTGQYANPQIYWDAAGDTKLLTDNTYRLQQSGIDAIIETMKNHPEISNNKNISIRIHQINGVDMVTGTSTSNVVHVGTDIITGNVNELEAKLKNIVEAQNPNSAKGSIIKLDLAWEVKSSPNIELAAQLKSSAQKLHLKNHELKQTKDEKIASKASKTQSAIKRLKKINSTSVGVIVGLIAFSVVREATAEELIAIDQSCMDPAFLEIKAVGSMLGDDPNLGSADDYVMKIEEACIEI